MKRIILLGFLFFLISYSWAGEKKTICLEDACLNVEVADSESLRLQGLSGRKKLSETEGMLFMFEKEGRHSFWMKDMLVGLDIIWIARDGTIVDIKEQLKPCSALCESLVPCAEALYALEVAAGFVARNHITVGSKVRF